MSLGSVVLFEDKIVADLFEQDLDQAGVVPVVINNQDTSLFFQHRPRHTYSFECQPPCGGVPLIFLQAKACVKMRQWLPTSSQQRPFN